MSDRIEIRHDGEVIRDRFVVGRIEFYTPVPGELIGDWYGEDPDWELQDELNEACDDAKAWQEQAEEWERQLSDLEGVEKELDSLRDEVRAFLDSETPSDPVSLERLKDALGGD